MGCAPLNKSRSAEVLGCVHDKYLLGDQLNKGAFGQVRVAQHKASPSQDVLLAVKVIDLRVPWQDKWGRPITIVDSDVLKKVCREADIWQRLGEHKHCVKFLEAFQDTSSFYMVMEKCQDSLLHHLESLRDVSTEELCRIFYEMLLGVSHVHGAGVVHRDIKPPNFLMGGLSNETVKLCDFGMAIQLPRTGMLREQCGTPAYMSPEMLGARGYSEKTDIWSLGVSMYVMLFGELPYMPPESGMATEVIKKVILKGIPEPPFKACPDHRSELPCADVVSLVKALLERAPEKRPHADQALRHPSVQPDVQARLEISKFFSGGAAAATEDCDDLDKRHNSASSFLTATSTQAPDSIARSFSQDSISTMSAMESRQVSGSSESSSRRGSSFAANIQAL